MAAGIVAVAKADLDLSVSAAKVLSYQRVIAFHVNLMWAANDAQVNGGIQVRKMWQSRQQPLCRKRGCNLHGQRTGAARLTHLLYSFFQFREACAQAVQSNNTLVGDHQATGQAVKQADAELIFKALDLMTDGAWSDVQFLGSLAEAKVSSRGFKCPQRVQ